VRKAMMQLPEIRNRVDIRHVDGTPEGYALRILKAYRRRCNEKWVVEGMTDNAKLIYDAMNEHQDLRAKELDRAIAILEKQP